MVSSRAGLVTRLVARTGEYLRRCVGTIPEHRGFLSSPSSQIGIGGGRPINGSTTWGSGHAPGSNDVPTVPSAGRRAGLHAEQLAMDVVIPGSVGSDYERAVNSLFLCQGLRSLPVDCI